jgi:hypothetical protein
MPANSISIVEVASNSSGVDVVEVGSDSGIQIVQINQGPAGSAATVDQTIIDGSTNAVAGNAVFDALALKAPLASPTFTGTVTAPHIHGSIAGNLYVHVRNTSGGTLTKGTPIYITGNVGTAGNEDRVTVAAADNTNPAKMPAVALLGSDLANNGDGNGIIVGELMNLNIPSYSINQELYVGAGAIATTKPTTGEVQSVGVVSRINTNTGIIVVNMQGRRDAATTAATANTLALRDATGGSNFAAVGASSVTSSGAISTTGESSSISTYGGNASIFTQGVNASIFTQGDNASISTSGANAHIQTSSTFIFYNGTHTTTLSHSPTDNRAIAFPDKAGTVAMVDAETHTGAHAFSSTTRPTSAGTGTPAATSLMTRDDVAAHAYFSRRLFGNCSGTTGGGGSGAISRRAAANGLFDGDISTSATLGAFYKINIVSGITSSSLMGVAASGSVNLSAKWSMFFRVALQMGTNSHFYLCIGADGVSGVPSSGTSVGMEITSATVARLFRCNAGAAVYSSNATISGITTSSQTTDLFFWVDNDGAGNLSLFFAPKLFSAAMPAKPATAIATLSGVASGFTGSDVAMYLRATAASPSVFTSLVMRDVVFTEY